MQDQGKTVAIIAHITVIGWIVALLMNNNQRTTYGSFYIRQVLGIFLLGLVCWLLRGIPVLGWISATVGGLAAFVLWIVSLINAASDKQTPVPLVGPLFQEWFRTI